MSEEAAVTPVAEEPEVVCCPETKKALDECIVTKGEAECSAEIEAHKQCMIAMGFGDKIAS